MIELRSALLDVPGKVLNRSGLGGAETAMMRRSRQTLEDVEVELLDDVNEVLGLAAG